MKLLSTLAPLVFSLVSAGKNNTRASLDHWTVSMTKVVNGAFDDLENESDKNLLDLYRQLNSEIPLNDVNLYRSGGKPMKGILTQYKIKEKFYQTLTNYGCWCNFKSDMVGTGIPVDKFDRICKQLSESYECATHEIRRCRPWVTEFNVPYRAYKIDSTADIREKCERSNRDASECVITSCMIQIQFVIDIFEAMFSVKRFDFSKRHDRGFKPSRDCKLHMKHSRVDRKCCGAYPKRTIYNSALRMCCEDGKSRMVC